MVVPGRLLASRGPMDLGASSYTDDIPAGVRHFSPAHYAGIFRELDVAAVVRLNASEYSPRAFEDAGIRHHDLFTGD